MDYSSFCIGFLQTHEVYDKFLANFTSQRPDSFERYINSLLKGGDEEDFIACAFNWECTPESDLFWHSLHKKFVNEYRVWHQE